MALQETTRKRRKVREVHIRLMHPSFVPYHNGQEDAQSQFNPDTLRPFRLYNAKAKVYISHRYYSDQRRAEWGVLKEMKWLPVGTVIDVVDVRYGHLLCTYQHIMENGKHGIRYEDF